MRNLGWAVLIGMFAVGCGAEGQEGDACEAEADCAEGLHCHVEDGMGVCEGEHEEEHDESEAM